MKIAVVGGGISGLVTAHLLSEQHEVHLIEARERLGGHTHTVDVEAEDGIHAIDTGFIVHNDWTYPNFVQLMNTLGVASQDSTMSFSVRVQSSGLEYNPSDLKGLFARRRNLLDPGFHRMCLEILRFNRQAPDVLRGPEPGPSLAQYLRTEGYSERFQEHYILPMGCAIWSSGAQTMRQFPARYFVQFFQNHGMLSVNRRPTWRVLIGGSRAYLEPLIRSFRERVRTGSPVTCVRRYPEYVELTLAGARERFDHVVLATHADQALKLLADPTDAERRVLSALPYRRNDVVLHTDTGLLPRRRAAWAAWNYFVPREATDDATLTYNMNILQGLNTQKTYLVSVNPGPRLDESKVLRRFCYAHPVFKAEGVEAQRNYRQIGGTNRTHYAGAYWGFGFHEDGVNSARRVCKTFGVSV